MDGNFHGIGYDLLITEIGMIVAGLAAIVGIWVERDSRRPARYAIWLSTLIALATFVGMFQVYKDDLDQKKVEADLARVLQSLDKIASQSDVDIPELNDLLKTEIAAQSRANPNVVEKFAQRVADEGGDPADVMAAYLPPAEVETMQRSGTLTTKPVTRSKPTDAKIATPEGGAAADAPAAEPTPYATRRRKLTFGGGPARVRGESATADGTPAIKPASAPIPAQATPAPADPPPADPVVHEPAAPGGPAIALRPGGLVGAGAAPANRTNLGGAIRPPPVGGAPKPGAAPSPAPALKPGGLKLRN